MTKIKPRIRTGSSPFSGLTSFIAGFIALMLILMALGINPLTLL